MRNNRPLRAGLSLFTSFALIALTASCAQAPQDPAAQGDPDEAIAEADAAILGGTSFASDEGHLVQMASCNGSSTCVTDVPMTGNASPLFAEVDLVMRQFMKTHCVGSGVLAVNYKGRRVYKRGFGRMYGSSMEDLPAHCAQDGYLSNVDYVLPDTDVNIGSVSKLITASMVRDLVWQRIVARGLQATYPDPTRALLLDPTLELLPPHLLRYLDQSRADAVCPPVAVPDIAGCVRAPGCGASGPDTRWQLVTIGDLLGHTAGLPKSAPSYRSTIVNAPLFRGHATAAQLLEGEHKLVRASTPYKLFFDDARQYIADTAGADVDDVFFISPWDRTDPAAEPVDEILTMVAGRCLRMDTSNPAGQSDSTPNGTSQYSNTGFAFLERVIAHLHPAGKFAAHDGEPDTEEATALQQFLEQEGLGTGVHNQYSMFPRQKLGLYPGGPQRRTWASATYAPRVASMLRPFCIWNGSSCDFTNWAGSGAQYDPYRLPANFDIDDGAGSVPLVPFEQQEPYLNPGTGNIAVEAPALLKLATTYFVSARNDIRLGKRRSGCANCDVTGYKDGDAGGTTARIMTLAGGGKNDALPPRDAAGRLTVQPDVGQWTNAAWTDADKVDFLVSVNQDKDEQGGTDGYGVESFIRWGLSRVDWAAVDRMIQHQHMNVVGVGINSAGNSYYWFEDEHKSTIEGLPRTHDLTPAPIPLSPVAVVPEAGAPGGQAPGTYELPSTRIGSDIVAVDIASNDRVYAWYDDGHVSAGNSGDLSSVLPAYPYSVPSGLSYNDIAGIAITSGDTVVSWFKNGKVSFGTSAALGANLVSFTLPPGEAMNDIVDMAISRTNDHTFTVFKDGSVAEGDYYDLDRFSFNPGEVLGMAMQNGDTTIWYQSGYRKELNGSPADNRLISNTQSTSDYFRLPAGYAHTDVAGVARAPSFMPRIWFKDGVRSSANSGGDFVTTAAAGSPGWPAGDDGNTAVALASHNGIIYSWYNTGRRAQGIDGNLVSVGQWPSYAVAPGQHELTIDAITIDTGTTGDGYVWTLFRDGAVARGRSNDLDQNGYWASPHANPLP